jgi:ribosomal protein S18 acetylase RimI-like enzyme
VIRRGGRGDVPFMRDMLRHAYYWRWGDPATADLPTSRYVDQWGRPGDAAMIALDDGIAVGAAWYRLFKRGAPGYGFVDESIPELTIAVVPSRRGRGFGEELLAALMERARQEGYEALSLSVEKDNPALRLYERFGFRPVDEIGDSVVMRADLSTAAREGQTP